MSGTVLLRILLSAVPVLLLDRITKIWVVEAMDLRNLGRIEVIDPYFNLSMAWNRGINFGLMNMGMSGRWVLVAVALAIVLGLLVWVRRADGWAAPLGVGLVTGGALGNVWDRVQYGAVADFINMSCCGIANPFAFNVADAAIFAGVAVLILFVRERPAVSG